MDRSSATNPSPKEGNQQSSNRIRVRKIPSTPRPEVEAPPMPYATVQPTMGTPQPLETSASESYLKIIKDMMGKFDPAGKVSDLLTQMADEIRKEEANHVPVPFEIPTDAATLTETSAAQIPVEHTTSQHPSPTMDSARNDKNQEDEAEVEEGEEGNSPGGSEEGQGIREGETREEPVEKNAEEKEPEVVVLEEGGSDEDEETLDERAARRNLRTQRKLETKEPEDTPEKAAAIDAATRETAERKRKGKQIATSSKKRKPHQASRISLVCPTPWRKKKARNRA